MVRRSNSEGGLASLGRQAELKDLREYQKALQGDLVQAKERVKEVKAQLETVNSKLGFCIDNWEQPDLPFPEGNGEHTP